MARKRMISPEIWESQSFGELSLLAKILFIGMISQADDDGKGVLSPQLLKSKILPYDELRVADVEKALKEIGHNASVAECADADKAREERGHKLSVTYYEVDGKKYYIFDNWKKWQTICRPIPSKFPNPPARGVGEDIHSHEAVNEYSMSNHRVVSEYSDGKEEMKRKEIKEDEESACAPVNEELEFYKSWLTDRLSDLLNLGATESEISVFNSLIDEVVRRRAIKINGVIRTDIEILKAFQYYLANKDALIVELTKIGDRGGEIANKLTYSIVALFNTAKSAGY